jgi:phosphatidate cytidylyltransferase
MLVKRWLTAIVLAALVIGVLLSGWTPLFFALLLVASALSHREYLVMAFPGQGQKPVRSAGIVLGLAVMSWPMVFPDANSSFFFSGLVLVSFLFFLFWTEDVAGALNRMGRFLLGLFYAPLLLSLFVYVWREDHGSMWLFFTLGVVFMGDSGAFYAGRYLGKHKLYPRMSPKKTVEGSLGGLAASILFALIFSSLAMNYTRWWECAILAVALNVSGQLGDLFESMLKRSAGVKDSGAFLPGHGGMLDRIDGVLFSSPVLCIYLKYLFLS